MPRRSETLGEQTAQVGRLPVFATLKDAAHVFRSQRISLLRTLALTGITFGVLDVWLHVSNFGWRGGFTALVVIANSCLFTLFAVTCHRYVLLGEGSVPSHGVMRWTTRETRFLAWSVAVGVGGLLVAVMLLVGAMGIESMVVNSSHLSNALWFFIVMVSSYLLARLSLVLPAAAIGGRPSLQWAIDVSRGNGWRLLVITAGPLSAFEWIVEPLGWRSNAYLALPLEAVDLVLAAFAVICLSLSYKFLVSADTGKSPPEAASLY